jgi:hypothetical protein
MKCLFALTALVAVASGQAPQPQTIEGIVVNWMTGEAVGGASVFVSGAGAQAGAVSDRSGHFQVTVSGGPNLMASASRSGFLGGSHANYPAKEGSPLRIEMTPASEIFGKLIDDDGFPVEGELRVYRVSASGQMRMTGTNAFCNDLGEFRATDLEAGKYYLRVLPYRLVEWDARYVTQFYPGVYRPVSESLLELKAGQKLGPLEFHVKKQQGVVVTGRLQLAGGARVPSSMWVTLSVEGPGDFGALRVHAQNGTFVFPHVPPGTYSLRATGQDGQGAPLSVLFDNPQLTVGNGDMRGLALAVRNAELVDLAGTVAFEGSAKPRPVTVTVQAWGAGATYTAKADDNGAFVVKGLPPGAYSVSARADRLPSTGDPLQNEVYVASRRWGEQDISEIGFDLDGVYRGPLLIRYAPAPVVSGRLLDASGRPVAGKVLAFFNPDAQSWPARVKTGDDGSFLTVVQNAGDYQVSLVRDSDSMRQLDLGYLRAAEGDFQPLHIVNGRNAIVLRLPAKP